MKRTKSGKILIRVGPDAAKRLARNEAIAKKQSERATRRAAKKAATAARRAARKAANAAAAARRKAARKAATKAKRQAERDKYNNTPPDQRPKRKTPWHPRGPYATGKYNSYARRLERSKKLTPSQISPTLYAVSRWLVKTTTSGDPISCNCPDFTQVEGARNWQGSNAGPFNPCKHMMAIKIKWKCANGVCVKDPTGTFNTEAECIASGCSIPCYRYLEVADTFALNFSTPPCGTTNYYFYLLADDEVSFSLTPAGFAGVTDSCGIFNNAGYITSNTGRNVDTYFYYTAISWRIISAPSLPPTSKTPYAGDPACPF